METFVTTTGQHIVDQGVGILVNSNMHLGDVWFVPQHQRPNVGSLNPRHLKMRPEVGDCVVVISGGRAEFVSNPILEIQEAA